MAVLLPRRTNSVTIMTGFIGSSGFGDVYQARAQTVKSSNKVLRVGSGDLSNLRDRFSKKECLINCKFPKCSKAYRC